MSCLASIGSWIAGWFNLIPKLIYFILVAIMSVLDAFQFMLRKIAGLDSYYIGESATPQTGDIALAFIRSVFDDNSQFPAIKNAFWSLMILGILLLIVTTIISVIRQEYMPGTEELKMKEKPSNNKIYVVTRSVKSLFLFLIVPVSVIFGLMLGDIILQAADHATTSTEITSALFENSQVTSKLISVDVNGKTSYIFYDIYGGALPTTSTSFSGQMFKTAAFTSSRIRKGETYDNKNYYTLIKSGELSNFEIFDLAQSSEEMALMIDDAFANNVHLLSSVDNSITVGPTEIINSSPFWSVKEGGKISSFSKFNVALVWYYYDLWQFNYIIGFGFLVICAQLMVNAGIGLAKRIIEMVALFIISPPIIATMPLDEGKAFNKWRQNFMSRALSSFGVIMGINIMFLLLPYISLIKLFPEIGFVYPYINLLFSTIFIILGLTLITSVVGMISKMIGADDAVKAGTGLVADVGATVKKAAMLTGGAVGFATKALDLATGSVTSKSITAIKSKAKENFTKRSDENKKTLFDRVANLGQNKKLQEEAEKASKNWERDEADKEYDEKMQNDENYKKSLNNAYNEFAKNQSGVSKEDWLNSDEGKQSAVKAENDFANSFGFTKDQYRSNQTFKDRFINSKKNSFISNRKKAITNALIKSTGALNVSTVSELFTEEMKDSFVRGGAKGGFSAMISAFKGKSSYDAELAGVKKKLQKEESMRAKEQMLQQEERRKKEKK